MNIHRRIRSRGIMLNRPSRCSLQLVASRHEDKRFLSMGVKYTINPNCSLTVPSLAQKEKRLLGVDDSKPRRYNHQINIGKGTGLLSSTSESAVGCGYAPLLVQLVKPLVCSIFTN